MWDKILNAVPETLKNIFGIIDKVVTDKDKANELKVAVALSETNSRFWLPACWRSIAMLALTGMVIALEIMQRSVPEWAYVILGLGLVGHMLNRDSVKQAKEIFKKGKK